MNINESQPDIFTIYQPNDNIFIQTQLKYYFINIHKNLAVYIFDPRNNFINNSQESHTVHTTPGIYISVKPLGIPPIPVKSSSYNSLFKDILLHIIQYCNENQKSEQLKEYLEYYTVSVPASIHYTSTT